MKALFSLLLQIDWKLFVKCETLDYDDAGGVTSDTFCACLRMSSAAAEQTKNRESERRQCFVNKVVIKAGESSAVER